MGKLFANLAGNIATISINLEEINVELDAEDIGFSNTVFIKKKLEKEEQNLNKIANLIQENTFTEFESNKLKLLIDPEIDHLKNIQIKLQDLQKVTNPYNYSKERNKLCRLLRKFNKKLTNLETTNPEAFSENFNDPNKNTELLFQLKTFKKHVKRSVELTGLPELAVAQPLVVESIDLDVSIDRSVASAEPSSPATENRSPSSIPAFSP